MVFGMFASLASAATTELTTAQKYQWFVDQGVLKGDPSGNPRLDATLTRAEFATIVASVGGLKVINSVSSFSDVKAADWYFAAIQSASDAGLVNGIGAGKFGPKLNVTVEQVIKVAVILANIKPVDGAVVAGSSAWAGPYIQAAINAGLAVPSNYKANATRGQTIDVAYLVNQLKAIPVLSDVAATVNADDTITVTGKVVGSADSVKVALGTDAAVAATLKDDKTFTYTTAKQSAGSYKLTVVAYDGTKASVAVEKTVSVDAFNVSSVTVQNSKQIVVKFNKPVQAGTLAGGHNVLTSYKLGTNSVVYPTVADLSDDKQTVTLTFANAFANNTYEQFVVSGLKSASGLSLAEFKQAISLSDTTAPSIANVSYVGKDAVVTFSEPVASSATDINAAVSLNGIQYTVNGTPIGYTFAKDAKGYVTLTFKGLEVGKAYTLNLIAVQDLVGNRVDLTSTLTVPSDTTAPTIVSVTPENGNLRIKFSEKVVTGVKVASAQGVVYSTADTDSNNEVVVATSPWIGSSFLNTSVTVSEYKDLVGNTGTPYTVSVTLTKDTAAPAFASGFVSGNKIVLKFNEDLVAPASNLQTATIDFVSTDSVRQSVSLSAANSTFAYVYDANGNGAPTDSGEAQYLVITVADASLLSSGALKNGTYKVTLPKNSVIDTVGNTNSSSEVTASITVSGNTSSGNAVVKLSAPIVQQGSKLTFTFSHALTSAALDVSKFLINGTALPTGTSFYFDGPSYTKVVAELPSGTIPVNGTRTIKVINIADKDGNVLSTTASDVQQDLLLKENVKPIAVSAALASDKSINVTFSENVLDPGTEGGVEIYVNNNKIDFNTNVASYTYVNNVLTIGLTNANTFAPGQTIVVKFASSNIKDANDNTVSDVSLTVQ